MGRALISQLARMDPDNEAANGVWVSMEIGPDEED